MMLTSFTQTKNVRQNETVGKKRDIGNKHLDVCANQKSFQIQE